jgi:hypothetical protein
MAICALRRKNEIQKGFFFEEAPCGSTGFFTLTAGHKGVIYKKWA